MPDYKELGLDQNMRALSSLSNSAYLTERDFKQYIDDRVRNVRRPGGLDFQAVKNTSLGYQAVVGKDNTGGAFTDLEDALKYIGGIGGGKILMLPGTYTYSGTYFNIPSNTSIEGLSPNSVIINGNNSYFRLQVLGSSSVRLKNLNLINCSTINASILLFHADDVEVESCKFQNNTRDIWGSYSALSTIKNCTSTLSGTFVSWDHSRPGNIFNNNFIDGGSIGFHGGTTSSGGGFSEYSNNHFQPRGTDQVVVSFFTGNFVSSTIRNNTQSLSGTKATYSDPIYNIFSPNTSTVGPSISNNRIDTSGGITCKQLLRLTTNDTSVSGNIILSLTAGSSNVVELGSAYRCTFTGNTIVNGNQQSWGNTLHLIASSRNAITGNFFSTAGTSPGYNINIADSGCVANAVVGNSLWIGTINDSGTRSVVANNAFS